MELNVIETKYNELDKALSGGFHNGNIIILSGRPAVGKTTFALNISNNVLKEPDLRQDHRPLLTDFSQSMCIVNEIDIVMMLYRDDYYNNDTINKDITEVIVAKNKYGNIDTFKLRYDDNYKRYENI